MLSVLKSTVDGFHLSRFRDNFDDETFAYVFIFNIFIHMHLVSFEIGNGNNKTLLENLVSVDDSTLPETTRQWKYHEKACSYMTPRLITRPKKFPEI